MKFHHIIPFAVALAALGACSSTTDMTAPETLEIRAERGLKPPPPLGSEETSILISIDSEGCTAEVCAEERRGGSGNDDGGFFSGFSGEARGRYLANKSDTQGWIQFVSNDDDTFGVLASNNAKLQLNERTGKTTGHGTLTDAFGRTIDLSKIEIIDGTFGPCSEENEDFVCATLEIQYGGSDGPFGMITVILAGASID